MGDSDVTPRDQCCFEAGIKFGSLYHQFAGTPVRPESAGSLARAMEEAIENQPHCRSVSVEIEREVLAREIDGGSADYTELTGRFLDVELVVEYEGRRVTAELVMDDEYPLMQIRSIE